MLTYILKRLLLMIPTILGVLTLTFIVIQFVPGGPVETILAEARAGAGGDSASFQARRDVDAKQVAELKALYGFDKPPLERYFSMLKNFAQFDLGKSYLRNKDVWSLIKEKLPVSISLGLWTFLVSYLISIPLGVAKAVREGTRFDTATTLLVLVGFAIPGFVLGVLLIVLFAGGSFLDWFPLRGRLGLLGYESIVRRDYAVVLGTLYFFTLMGLVVKLIGDLLYVVVDPRVQFAAVGK